MSERAAPFHCPYCGEEDLRPLPPESLRAGQTQQAHGSWLCGSCRRAFALRFIGLQVAQ
jgi:transposase-like protein